MIEIQDKYDIVFSNSIGNILKYFNNRKRAIKFINYSFNRACHYNRYYIIKSILMNYKKDIYINEINNCLIYLSFYNNSNISRHIIRNYMNKLSTEAIHGCLVNFSYNRNINMLKYILYNFLNRISDNAIEQALYNSQYNTYTKMNTIIEFYMYIKENNLCPEKYKNTIFVV
jgi:hypothetical protein